MTLKRMLVPISVVALTLGMAVPSVQAQQRDGRQERAGRGGEGRAVPRANSNQHHDARGAEPHGNVSHYDDHRNDNWHGNAHPGAWNGYHAYREPHVVVVPRPVYPRRYGNGGHFSVYFGLGSGYLYGAPYAGRVYGYAPPVYAGAVRYYGDVRLQVNPRDAQVFVDGYYAGIVDNFDGVFQRLTLTVGPHEITIDANGLQPRTFNVYVDPSRTIDLHADLFNGD